MNIIIEKLSKTLLEIRKTKDVNKDDEIDKRLEKAIYMIEGILNDIMELQSDLSNLI